jgi:uncharacterized protein (TIGR02284 family)
MENEIAIRVLNSLIVINNDRVEGYETAVQETEETDLKDLFARLSETSKMCKMELITEVHKLGGTPDEGTRVTGKFFRVWMDVKAFLTGKDRVSILNSCEYGENAAQDAYAYAFTEPAEFTSTQQAMITKQKALLAVDLHKVITLRDALQLAAA